MVLEFEISHSVKRKCIICNEYKLIPINSKPICKDCLKEKRTELIYSFGLIVILLMISFLIAIFYL